MDRGIPAFRTPGARLTRIPTFAESVGEPSVRADASYVFAGRLELTASARSDGRTYLSRQACRAPYHLSKPYWDAETGVLAVQVVNPTAGILAGDRLESSVTVDSGASLLLTTPSASRVFRMNTGTAECRQDYKVGSGSWLEVLPEPLVPHSGSRYRQTSRLEVEPGGTAFIADLLMPGRIAHGETWGWDRLVLSLEVRTGTDLALRERLELSGVELRELARLFGSGSEACFGNAVLISAARDDKPAWLRDMAALHRPGLWLGVGRLRTAGWSIKFVAHSPLLLRQTLKDIRRILAPSLPRIACDTRKL